MNQTGDPPSPPPNADSDVPTQAIRGPHDRTSAAPGAPGYPFLSPPQESGELGRLGPYRVLRLLGTGGMGMVFLAEDPSLHRQVALKVMRRLQQRSGKNKETDQARFLREARAMAAIKHPRLVTLYHAEMFADTIYLAMELLEGETLESWVERTERPDVADVLRMGRDIALGLTAIHEAGLVHRDLKPSNLWLEAGSGRVKILDFGLAREVNDSTQITEAGFVIGTPAFLSPEQVRGKKADHLSDLFSLGCVLYRLCTRKLPFAAANALDQLAAITNDDPPFPQSINPNLPPALCALVLQLLAKDPSRRPHSAAEVAERLQEIKKQAKGRSRKPVSESLNIRVPRQPFLQRHALKLLIGAGAVLVLAAIIVTALLVSPRSVPDRKAGKDARGAEKPGVPEFLDQLKPAQTGNWPFMELKGGKGKGRPPGVDGSVVVRGVPSPHGIFMHPAPKGDTTFIAYKLDRNYRTFAAQVTLNDTAQEGINPVTFRVFGDDVKLWESRPVRFRNDTQEVAVSVKNVALLRIQVDIQGEPMGAHAVWVEPRLEK